MRKAGTRLKFRPPNSNHDITMAKACIPIPSLTEKNKKNFHKKISATPTETGCLEWTAWRGQQGYGGFGAGGKHYVAHRLAYFLETGVDPQGYYVCHHCDNPPCCNPEHLFLGTAADNMRDKTLKGRGNTRRGKSHYRSKLTESDIPLIRADSRVQRVIAEEYGVDQSIISEIKSGKRWSHVA